MSLVCLGLAGCGGAEKLPLATLDDLELGDDGLRLKSSDALYSGYLVEYYPRSETNQLRSRSLIRAGKLNGLSEGWYAGGQLQVSETFIDGKSHGTRTGIIEPERREGSVVRPGSAPTSSARALSPV